MARNPEGVRQGHLLRQSRHVVLRLAALFSLDAFAGGFVIQSLLALWLFERFDLSLATAGIIFFWTGALSAFSYFIAARVADRIELLNTMVFTHLPANLCLVLTAFAPSLGTAIALLLIRSALSQMDVPTRTAYVMTMVSAEERPAAVSVTAVPRSLAAAVSPMMLSGALLAASTFGWPLVIAEGLRSLTICSCSYFFATSILSRRPSDAPEALATYDVWFWHKADQLHRCGDVR